LIVVPTKRYADFLKIFQTIFAFPKLQPYLSAETSAKAIAEIPACIPQLFEQIAASSKPHWKIQPKIFEIWALRQQRPTHIGGKVALPHLVLDFCEGFFGLLVHRTGV
jgi:hypothetical protein